MPKEFRLVKSNNVFKACCPTPKQTNNADDLTTLTATEACLPRYGGENGIYCKANVLT